MSMGFQTDAFGKAGNKWTRYCAMVQTMIYMY